VALHAEHRAKSLARACIRLGITWILLSGCAAAQETTVKIRSWGGGYAGTPGTYLQFSCSPSIELAEDAKCRQVRGVLAAAEQRVPSASGNPMGITSQWLTANVDAAAQNDLPHAQKPTSEQLALFRSAFVDASLIKQFCCRTDDLGHTDDYPHARVEILGQGGRRILLSSDRQNLFMVPWTLEEAGKRSVVNDRAIGDALYKLLPAGFPNRDRIGGINLRAQYSGFVLSRIQDKWDIAGSSNRLGSVFKEMGKRFQIVESSITYIGSVDVEGAGWWGKVRFPDASIRGNVGFFFPMIGDQPPNPRVFYAQIDGLVQRVKSVPWLTRYLSTHKSAQIELRFVDDRSLSGKAAKDMIDELRKNGKPSQAGRVGQEYKTCVFVEIEDGPRNWSRWVILSNSDMLLWHFQGPSALGYPTRGRRMWDSSGWKGIGLTVRPDGSEAD
jgi:hypothetical protein